MTDEFGDPVPINEAEVSEKLPKVNCWKYMYHKRLRDSDKRLVEARRKWQQRHGEAWPPVVYRVGLEGMYKSAGAIACRTVHGRCNLVEIDYRSDGRQRRIVILLSNQPVKDIRRIIESRREPMDFDYKTVEEVLGPCPQSQKKAR